MPEFLELVSPDEALQHWLVHLPGYSLDIEVIDTSLALGRVTAEPVIASYPLPSFTRSAMDGYAVRAADTYGASDALPAYLKLVGEIPMGAATELKLQPGECALIHTGGMLPDQADAVVMVEQTQSARLGEVEISHAAAVGENVICKGEDVAQGEQVIGQGVRLRPQEIGGLMALGITRLRVFRQLRVGLISSGDEVIPPTQKLLPGQVRDVNSFSLGALVVQNGAIPVQYGIVPDQAEALRSAAQQALAECDMVLITAGSSASARDLTSQVISELGEPGVLVHGVSVRPGKPTILAVCDGKAVVGLPGNPVSAMVIAILLVAPVLQKLSGVAGGRSPRGVVTAQLSLNLPSQAGREDWVAVRLQRTVAGYQADPVFGKSNLIFTLVRADGLVRIPPAATGLSAGEIVEVMLI
jgi:molybdopterin molybdotransferase